MVIAKAGGIAGTHIPNRWLVAGAMLVLACASFAAAQDLVLPSFEDPLTTPEGAAASVPYPGFAGDPFGMGEMDFSDGTDTWVSTEALVWWRKGMALPTLATDAAVPANVLFGSDEVGKKGQAGGRLNLGYWLNDQHTFGLGGSFFMLGEVNKNFDSSGAASVVRPFTVAGVPNVLVVHLPADPVGTVTALTTSDILGGDFFVRRPFFTDGPNRIDLLTGYMGTHIHETVTVRHQFVSGGITFDGTDYFVTKNKFHGLELGLLAEHRMDRWSLEVLAKLGLGVNRQTVLRSGSNIDGAGVATNGSLLVRPNNAGILKKDRFSSVREVGVKVVRHVSDNFDISFGYTFIHWKSVAQAGDQIDLEINNIPLVPVDADYFIHGLNLEFVIEL